MSEMLGNQFFMARKYGEAEEQLEKCLARYPESKPIRKKLVICYTQTGKVNLALDTFISLINEDVEFIINTNPVEDDCPCPELVYEAENLAHFETGPEENIKFGMLWLYCNVHKSLENFRKALEKDPGLTILKPVIILIEKYLDDQRSSDSDGKVMYGY